MNSQELTLEVQIRNKFGRNLIYAVNETAKAFTILTGKKTLDPEDLKRIKNIPGLNVTIEWVPQSVDLEIFK